MLPFHSALLMQGASAGGGSDPYGAHAYWRVFVSNNHGDTTGIVIDEVEFRATAGGADQATGGTAIGSDDAGGNEFAKAFDGTTALWFADSGPTNQWIGYHFASAVSVAEVYLRLAASGTNAITRMPQDCHVDYSDDGSSWTTAFSFSIYNNLLGGEYTFPDMSTPAAGEHLFWRVFCIDNNGGTRIGLKEVEFRATVGGADQAPTQSSANGTSTGRAIYSSQPFAAWQAFDDSTGTEWGSTTTTNEWIGFVFRTPVSVAQVAMTAPAVLNRGPDQVHVDYSDDGSTWTAGSTVELRTWTTSLEVKTINL